VNLKDVKRVWESNDGVLVLVKDLIVVEVEASACYVL